MRYLSTLRCYALMAVFMLASPAVMAYQDHMSTVNASCGVTAITDCAGCHSGGKCSVNSAECTTEQTAFLSGDYCSFCPDSTVCPVPVSENDEDMMLSEARQAVNTFGSVLMAKFQEAMMNGGPINAINVCTEIAPEIASDISRETGWMVRRVTTRTRSPLATPDGWELSELGDFERELSRGTPAAELEVSGIKREGKGKGSREYFRYMKGIVLPPPEVAPCMSCHGDWDTLDPAIQDVLNTNYPHDRATGYSPGQVRGAFSVKRLLK